ncbi:hypothetical protein [Streptomyces sp. R08]|uniref:Uncharacterized protein n=1 Tax=Streptomyces sp. R08 TaxID=3238624 RepID=A0AB39M3G3_9ACTN
MASLSLRRRARTAGVALTPDALADRQTRQLRVLRPSVGWSDRMCTEPKASDRIAVTGEKGHEEIWFRRRPGRHGHTVWGCSRPRAGVVLELWSPGERRARERACRAGELGVGAVVP